jgi:hypothetical protein
MPITTQTPLTALSHHRNMALQTRKRDGTWVSTPVNPLVEGDHVYFRTWRTSGKNAAYRAVSAAPTRDDLAQGWHKERSRGSSAVHKKGGRAASA